MASTRIHIDEARLGRVQKQDRIATGVLTAIVAIVMLIVVSMVAYILFEGISTLFQPGFLTQPARANGTQSGVLYQLFDSFYLLLITLGISVPISLGGAVFLVEYAPDGPIRDIASTAIETLSSLPSIVVGMFGFLVFSVQLGWKYSIISGAVALTMFNIPILVRVIQQALEDVPQAQRDACLAMGLTRWEATLHILIPEAMPAIVGFGAACAAMELKGEIAHLTDLRDRCRQALADVPGLVFLGRGDAPHIVTVSVPGLRSQGLINCLQEREIYVSAGSACSRGHRSHVLEAMGLDSRIIDGAIRISFGRDNTPEDVDALKEALLDAVVRLQ